MSRCRQSAAQRVLCGTLFTVVLVFLSIAAVAQDQPTPKADIFIGYQWLHPGAVIPAPGSTSDNPAPFNLKDMAKGLGGAVAYNFDRHFALEADFGHNWSDQGYESTYSVGPRLMFRSEDMNFFVHTLLSLNRLNVDNLASDNGVGAILGGGMDLALWPHLSIRLFEADYVWAHHHFPDFADESFPDLRRPSLDGVRLRGGLVFNLGGAPVVTPSASCSVQPGEVMVGEPVTATATVTNANPKHTLVYTWSGNGGKVTGKDNTASIDTNGVAGGSYTVTAHVTDPKMKKGGEVSCSATYSVKEPPKNPPTMSCSANPTTVQAGGTSTLTCNCSSPDNVPVTVSNWSATGGSVSGNGSTATLNTSGAPAGPITVSASCSDPRGLSTSSSTQVTVEVPPPPPPQASKLSQCDFPNEKKPWRVDNTCKAVLDDVAKNLQQNADNKLVIVGNADPSEKRKNLAAERAVDAKAYLSKGEAQQAIDPSRIETRTGSAGTKTAEFWVVPPGATFSGEGTQPVDENMVKPVPDHPAPPMKGMKKKKAATP